MMTSIASDAPLTLTVQKIPVPRLQTSVPESNAEYGNFRNHSGNSYANYMGEHDYILADICRKKGNDESDSAKDIKSPLEDDMQFKRPTASRTIRAFLRAGPRKKLYFDPKGMKAAVVTCGGCALA